MFAGGNKRALVSVFVNRQHGIVKCERWSRRSFSSLENESQINDAAFVYFLALGSIYRSTSVRRLCLRLNVVWGPMHCRRLEEAVTRLRCDRRFQGRP